MRRTAVTLAALAALGLSACGSSNDDKDTSSSTATSAATATPAATDTASATATATTAAGGDNAIAVKEAEWSITPSADSIKAGKVTFNVQNAGKFPHEFVVIKTDKQADALGSGNHVPETGSVGEIGDLGAKANKSKTFDLKPGHYVLICNLPTHYKQGMHVDFTVN